MGDEQRQSEDRRPAAIWLRQQRQTVQLESRPPPEKVTLVAQTESSEETNTDVEMRGVGEQKLEPPIPPKAKKVTMVAQTEPPEETNMGVQEMREDGAQQQEQPQEQQQDPNSKEKRKEGGGALHGGRQRKAKQEEGE
jgi:hypothetical protein